MRWAAILLFMSNPISHRKVWRRGPRSVFDPFGFAVLVPEGHLVLVAGDHGGVAEKSRIPVYLPSSNYSPREDRQGRPTF